MASDGTAAPVGGSSEINSTNGNVTNSGSNPESKVTPNQDSKELSKQTSPEVKPDIVENINNQKEIQTYYQKKGNFEQYDNANPTCKIYIVCFIFLRCSAFWYINSVFEIVFIFFLPA